MTSMKDTWRLGVIEIVSCASSSCCNGCHCGIVSHILHAEKVLKPLSAVTDKNNKAGPCYRPREALGT